MNRPELENCCPLILFNRSLFAKYRGPIICIFDLEFLYMQLEDWIRLSLEEDLGEGDHTSRACIGSDADGEAKLLVKEAGILAGCAIAERILRALQPDCTVIFDKIDGQQVLPGDIAFAAEGNIRHLMAAERLVLNVMQRMSGIATTTKKMTEAVQGTGTQIMDTRKTTPLMRSLEKEAVKLGGGENHRMGLYDMILVKDNHIDFSGGITMAITRVRDYLKSHNLNLKLEIEARSLKDVEEIMTCAPVDRILLDNFSPDQISKALAIIDGKVETEASGGITLENVLEYAETGVQFISSGALTHSVKSLDLSFKAVLK
jgi:nicotinate-nucleotide pyrophosphorylase (carboxylating)